MATFETFSKRQKRHLGDVPDVYVYEEISKSLRVQIVHIIRDSIGEPDISDSPREFYAFIHKSLCKEYGVFTLKEHARSNEEAVLDYLLNCDSYERCLDIVEICFRIIENYVARNYDYYKKTTTSTQDPIDAVNELNSRFKEAGVGYQFESGELIRIDSQFIHSETVKPVLHLLSSDKAYRGANDEFLSAHEHYRHKRYKECLNDCLKSFESLMKAIHEKHCWSYNQNDTAKKWFF